MPRLVIDAIPCLRDNYCYLITGGSDAWLVDPSEPDPPAAVLDQRGLSLRGILATHHHFDHVGGIEALVDRYAVDQPVWVAGHTHDRGRIPCQSVFADAPLGRYEPSEVMLADVRLSAMHIPGHTLGAIAWCIPADDDGPADVFTATGKDCVRR